MFHFGHARGLAKESAQNNMAKIANAEQEWRTQEIPETLMTAWNYIGEGECNMKYSVYSVNGTPGVSARFLRGQWQASPP